MHREMQSHSAGPRGVSMANRNHASIRHIPYCNTGSSYSHVAKLTDVHTIPVAIDPLENTACGYMSTEQEVLRLGHLLARNTAEIPDQMLLEIFHVARQGWYRSAHRI